MRSLELNIFDVGKVSARTWNTESGHAYLEITIHRYIDETEETINLIGPYGIAFARAAQGINEAFR